MTPDVRVVRGDPDEMELAALVAGLASGGLNGMAPAGSGRAERRAAAARRRWREAARPLRDPLTPGGDAWRWSGRTPQP